jgi:hypothetical protein
MANVPNHAEPMVDRAGRVSPAWLNYLRGIASGDVDVSAAVTAIATALGSPDGSVSGIPKQTASTVNIVAGDGIALYRNSSGYVLYLSATTDLVAEGANLYFTDDRAVTAVDAAHLTGSKTYDPPSIANAAQDTTTVTVTGAALGGRVSVALDIDAAGLLVSGYVSAADTVTVIYANLTGAAVDLASHTLSVWVR